MVKISKICSWILKAEPNSSANNYKYIQFLINNSVSFVNNINAGEVKNLIIKLRLSPEIALSNEHINSKRIDCCGGNISIGIQYVCFVWIVCYLFCRKDKDKVLFHWGKSLFTQNSEWPFEAISPLSSSDIQDVNQLCTSVISFSLLHEIGHAKYPPSVENIDDITCETEFLADEYAKSIYYDENSIIVSFLSLEIYNRMRNESQELLCTPQERLSKLGICIPDFDEKVEKLKTILCNYQTEPSFKEENIE